MTRRGLVWLLGAVAGLGLAGQAAADEAVHGAGIERTIDCAGGRVTISGTSHRLTLRGRCARVILSGTGSVVHIESLGRLTVSGVSQRVEWVDGLDGNEPTIQKSGIGNEVVRVKAGAAASSRSTGGTRRSGGGSVETGPGGVVVEGSGSRVTVGADGGVTVDSGSSRSGSKDKVTVNSGGTTVAVDSGTGTVKVGAGGTKAGTLTVVENDIERTFDCAGGTAVIQGNDNVLTLRNCPELVVNGNSNTLTLQGGVRLIKALGNGNRITWSEGVDGKNPNVESLGSGNSIKRSGGY